jgi:hypothetical protein
MLWAAMASGTTLSDRPEGFHLGRLETHYSISGSTSLLKGEMPDPGLKELYCRRTERSSITRLAARKKKNSEERVPFKAGKSSFS